MDGRGWKVSLQVWIDWCSWLTTLCLSVSRGLLSDGKDTRCESFQAPSRCCLPMQHMLRFYEHKDAWTWRLCSHKSWSKVRATSHTLTLGYVLEQKMWGLCCLVSLHNRTARWQSSHISMLLTSWDFQSHPIPPGPPPISVRGRLNK